MAADFSSFNDDSDKYNVTLFEKLLISIEEQFDLPLHDKDDFNFLVPVVRNKNITAVRHHGVMLKGEKKIPVEFLFIQVFLCHDGLTFLYINISKDSVIF